MISSNWETPIQQDLENKNVQQSFKNKIDKRISDLPIQLSLFAEIETGGLFPNKNLYDPNGLVPFPKTFDLDDKQTEIQKTLDTFGITCPGADSVTVKKDPLDPFTTIITIKKTIF